MAALFIYYWLSTCCRWENWSKKCHKAIEGKAMFIKDTTLVLFARQSKPGLWRNYLMWVLVMLKLYEEKTAVIS